MTSTLRRIASVHALKVAFETKRWGPFVFEIDRPKGFVKTWDQPDGSVKKYTYPVDYGYFKGHTDPGDGEGLDAFVGDDPQGKIESFLKMKEEDGKLVPDETKFMVGLTDPQREKVLGLYKPEEVTDLREYEDFYELVDVLEDYKDKKAKKSAAVPDKYKHIDFKPPQSVADAAAKGLEYRQKASPSNRGGLTPSEAAKEGIGSGVQRAVNLKNRDNISPDVIKQMTAFFSRHEKNKGVAPEHKGEPWNDKGNVAWLIWGGDPGRAWAEKVKKQMETADEKSKKESAVKPATPSQISYAKVLIEQGIRGLKGIPGWLKPGDAPSDTQLASMDAVSISTLIDSLKARKPFKVEGYGNGAYKVVRKAAGKVKFPEVVKGILDYVKKGPFKSYFKVKSARGNTLVLIPVGLNDQVDRVELGNLDQDNATFIIHMKNGDSGWSWDEWRHPVKFQNDPGYNVLKLAILDRIANPTTDPIEFANHMGSFFKTLSKSVQRTGWVIDPATKKPMKMDDWNKLKQEAEAARVKQEAEAKARAEAEAQSLDGVKSRLRSIKLGPAGRVRSIEQYSPTEWTVDPSNRQRLDHYVGEGYNPGEDDDPEGWDSEGWEEEYSGPTMEAGQKWLDDEFGKGLFGIDVGEKGHVHIFLTQAGRTFYSPKKQAAEMELVNDPAGDPVIQRLVGRHLEELDRKASIEKWVLWLESLWSDVQVILDTFTEVVPMPHVGRIATQLHSQQDLFQACVHGMRHCEAVINHCRTYLQLHPGDEDVSRSLRDAQDLYERFQGAKATAKEVLSAIHQKIMPKDLKAMVEGVLYGLRDQLNYPNQATVTVGHRFVPTDLGGKKEQWLKTGPVSGITFDAYITVYPLPKDTAEGRPAHQQFILTQGTLGDTAVYLTVVDRTNAEDPQGPTKVGTADAALKKVLSALKGWSNLKD